MINIEVLIILLGIIATITMDIWSIILRFFFKIYGLDYRFVGRWVLSMFDGKLFHHSIFNSEQKVGERIIGQLLHYTIGISFAYVLILVTGKTWFMSPTITPALLVGIATIVAPFLFMQPCFGLGIAGSLTPSPWALRFKSLMAHTSYGLGLYLGGKIINLYIL